MSAGLTGGNSTDFESGTANALNGDVIASVDINDFQAAYFQVTGTFSATCRVQGSDDNTNFQDVLSLNVSSASTSPALDISAPGMFYCPIPFRYFRLRITAYTSGTVSGIAFFQSLISGDLGPRTVNAIQSGTWTVNQGSPNSLANAWPVKVTDGTNTMPTMDVAARAGFQKLTDGTNTTAVKAASTPAAASDPSAVVAFSPNSPLPSGTNIIGKVSQDTSPWVTKDQADGTIGSAVPSIGIQVAGSDGTNLRALSTDGLGRLKLAGSSYFHPIFSAKVQSTSTVTTVLSTSLSATIAATKAGNTIMVIAAVNAGTLTVTDSASQSYSTATTIAGNATQTFKIFYFPNTAAGVTSVTISSTSSTDLNLIVMEYAGVLTVSPLDQTSTHAQTAANSWTSNSTPTTTQASELLIGGVMGTLHNNDTLTPSAGWNSIATALNTRGGANLELQVSDQTVSAIGTYAYTGAMTGNASDNIYAVIATFKLVTPNMMVQANTPVTIKSGSGILRTLVLNTLGTGSASATFYDNTTNSGNIIATVALTGQVTTLEYNLIFSTGLTMVLNSTSPDFTVVYD